MRARHRLTYLLVAGSLLATAAGCSCDNRPPARLVVDLQTDFAPGLEFDTIHVAIDEEVTIVSAEPDQSYLEGHRVAEVRAPIGPRRVNVALFFGATFVAERLIIVQIDTDTAVTVPVLSRCRGVVCPDPNETCVAGTCTYALSLCGGTPCDPEDPEECPMGSCARECETDAECTPIDDCSAFECLGRVCVGRPLPDSCTNPQFCAVGLGCREPPSMDDAGVPADAGIDASGAVPCGSCTTGCGSVGAQLCDGLGDPVACVPPAELCNFVDDDCDVWIDEAPTCPHTHPVVFNIDSPDGGIIISRFVGGGEGQVCAAGSCASEVRMARTLPGPNGHVHDVFFNGATSLSFAPVDGQDFGPTGVGTADEHTHPVECSIMGDAGVLMGTTFFHEVDMTDPMRFDLMCVPPRMTGPCRQFFGDCMARRQGAL